MLLYDFYCDKCKRIFELFINSPSEAPKCPICDRLLQRQLSAPPFFLKGGGWAKDNYSRVPKKEQKNV